MNPCKEKKPFRLDDYLGLFVLMAMGVVGVYDVSGFTRRALVLLVVLAIIALVALPLKRWLPNRKRLREHARQAVLVLLVITLPYPLLNVNFFVCVLIFFVLSAYAMEGLPAREGYAWVSVYSLVSFVFLFILQDVANITVAIFNALLPAAGNFFFAGTTITRKRANVAERESRQLLMELRAAHTELQAYADRVESLTLLEERNRLSREMHDTLGHRLTVAAVQLEGAQKLTARDPEKAAQMIETVHGQVVEGLGELRRTVAALREPADGAARQPSLAESLRELAHNFAQATSLELHLDLADDLPSLDANQYQALYRAAQESLTNIQRHAQASQAWLSLRHQNGDAPPTVRLTVRDNGVGLAESQASGFGLRGLRERAAKIGGTFEVESQPGAGVKSTFVVPIDW